MKKLISFFSLFCIALFVAFAQNNDCKSSQLLTDIESGDIAKLSTYMNGSLELSLLNSDNVYSKSQSKIILEDFFRKNKPNKFETIHESEKNNAVFIIGNLHTNKGIYRVSILLKKDDTANFLIYQLRIENGN